jgi:hypothetical protein
MPSYTDEPPGLRIINNLNTNAFGSVVSQTVWFLGSTVLTLTACYLLTRNDTWEAVGAFDEAGRRALVMHSRETMRQLGNALAIALLAAWTGKTVAGVVDSNSKRKTHPEYATVVKAQAEGKAAGTAKTAQIVKDEVDRITREQPIPLLDPSTAPPKQEVNFNRPLIAVHGSDIALETEIGDPKNEWSNNRGDAGIL